MDDLFYGFGNILYASSEEKKAELFKLFFEVTLPNWCEKIQKRFVDSGKKFLINDTMTVADFSICAFASGTFKNELFPMKE